MVPAEPAAVRPRTNRVAAGVSFLVIGAMAVALVLFTQPTTRFITKRDCIEIDQAGTCTKLGPTEEIERAIAPASATAVGPLVRITGVDVPGGDGDLMFVTVRQPELDLLDWIALRSNPAASLHSHEDLFGNETPAQQRTRSLAAMTTSKDVAEYVAMRAAGYDARVVPGAVVVNQFSCLEVKDNTCTREVDAAKVLKQGDTLLTVDGKDTPTLEALRKVLGATKVGDTVTVTYRRKVDGKDTTGSGSVVTLPAPDDANRPIIGFLPQDTDTVSLPDGVKVEIATNDIGGPSAGLAFTLTLIDELTAGNLTGGQRVAVTGTMDIDGNVGPIGGLSSKGSAVMQRGVKYFIVPTAQGEADLDTLRRVVGDEVEILPVATVSEALQALQKIGGDPMVPAGPAVPRQSPDSAPDSVPATAP